MVTKKGSKAATKKGGKAKSTTKGYKRTGKGLPDCAGVDIYAHGNTLTVKPSAESGYLTVDVTAQGTGCRTAFRKCWDGEGWVDC